MAMKHVLRHASIRLAGCLVALALAAGCTHPAEPSPPILIVITSVPDVLLVGESAALAAANAVTGEPVDAQWSSSNAAVASVSDAQLSAIGAGRATVTATYQGARADATVKVVPRYAGTYPAPPDVWGTAYDVACVDLAAPGFCAARRGVDRDLFRLEVTQSKDTVSAQCGTPNVFGVLTGEIDDGGLLTLRGRLPTRFGTIGCRSQEQNCGFQEIKSWSSYLDASGSMYGTFTSRFVGENGVALMELTQELRGISHGP